jgi:hypothetical protein
MIDLLGYVCFVSAAGHWAPAMSGQCLKAPDSLVSAALEAPDRVLSGGLL